MIKNFLINNLNKNCNYRNDEGNDGYYFEKWTEDDFDFDNNNNRGYCVEIRDGHRPDYYLCDSCKSFLEQYKDLDTDIITMQMMQTTLNKILERLEKIENDIIEIKSIQKL